MAVKFLNLFFVFNIYRKECWFRIYSCASVCRSRPLYPIDILGSFIKNANHVVCWVFPAPYIKTPFALPSKAHLLELSFQLVAVLRLSTPKALSQYYSIHDFRILLFCMRNVTICTFERWLVLLLSSVFKLKKIK